MKNNDTISQYIIDTNIEQKVNAILNEKDSEKGVNILNMKM